MSARDKTPKLSVARDRIIFCVGIGGIIYETVVEKVDRPQLLLLYAAMVGLPAWMKRDRNGNGKNGNDGGE